MFIVIITRILKGVASFKIFLLGQDTGYPTVVRKLEDKFRVFSAQKYAVSFNSEHQLSMRGCML